MAFLPWSSHTLRPSASPHAAPGPCGTGAAAQGPGNSPRGRHCAPKLFAEFVPRPPSPGYFQTEPGCSTSVNADPLLGHTQLLPPASRALPQTEDAPSQPSPASLLPPLQGDFRRGLTALPALPSSLLVFHASIFPNETHACLTLSWSQFPRGPDQQQVVRTECRGWLTESLMFSDGRRSWAFTVPDLV